MAAIKANEIQQADILRLEAEMNHLWGELNTANVSYATRLEIEKRLSECEESFKNVLGGQASIKDLEANLKGCDKDLALAAVKQAEVEIPKTEKTSSCFLALESLRTQLTEGQITPLRARHEVKEIMRHHR